MIVKGTLQNNVGRGIKKMNGSQWLRKLFVILVTIFTFGLVTPSFALDNNFDEAKSQKRDIENHSDSHAIEQLQLATLDVPKLTVQEQFLIDTVQKAEQQSMQKFGTRIKPVIETEFREVILPKMEEAIVEIATELPEEDVSNLRVTELPGGGSSEMIFNIVDEKTNKDVVRFHVRKDHPPQEGYWFNFHYHTFADSFQSHHDLGSIYWDKNTPPKWLN